MTTLRERFNAEKQRLIDDAVVIRTASYWAPDYLVWGSSCDSSDRAKVRMDFVNKAIQKYSKEHKQEILDLAAELCLKSIGDPLE
jgi:hypothetical protein